MADYGVQPEGFKAKKFIDIFKDLASAQKTELNIDIDSDPDSVAKAITNIYALALSKPWAATQELQAMFDVSKAEGVHLDNLVGYIGLTRQAAAASQGTQYITGTVPFTIPANSVFVDEIDNTYHNTNSIIVDTTSCVSVDLVLSGSVSQGDIISVVIGDITSAITVGPYVGYSLHLLIAKINNNHSDVTATESTDEQGYALVIQGVNDKLNIKVTYSSNFSVKEITGKGLVYRDDIGEFNVAADTVTTPPSINGVTSTTNRYPYITGRPTESDIDLRNRHSLSLSTAGAATVEAIRADLLRVPDVTTAIVQENDTLEVNSLGIPKKGVLSVVKGGSDEDIAKSLWESVGAGIQMGGNTTVIVVDSQGINQVVKFSRPTEKYVHLHAEYSIYSEEADEWPLDGETQIKNQLIAFGETLTLGSDVIPQRFSSSVFNNVGGLSVVNITAGVTTGANDPTPTLSSNIIPIDAISEAVFDEIRITLTEV